LGIFNGLAEGESETKSLDQDYLSFISNIAVSLLNAHNTAHHNATMEKV